MVASMTGRERGREHLDAGEVFKEHSNVNRDQKTKRQVGLEPCWEATCDAMIGRKRMMRVGGRSRTDGCESDRAAPVRFFVLAGPFDVCNSPRPPQVAPTTVPFVARHTHPLSPARASVYTAPFLSLSKYPLSKSRAFLRLLACFVLHGRRPAGQLSLCELPASQFLHVVPSCRFFSEMSSSCSPAFHASPLPLPRSPHSSLPLVGLRRPCRSPTMVASRERTRRVTALGLIGGNSELPSTRVKVLIDAPARNKRTITASNLISAPLPIIWELLSDYNRLADYIPNLALSERRLHPANGIRVEQCGAQNILGFEFRASLTMDMKEVNGRSQEWRAIEFGLVTSRDFKEFEGVWRMEAVEQNKTALYYSVNIVPKGLVPVRAIEWRISEDVPGNLNAIRQECERRRRNIVAEKLKREEMARMKLRDA